MHLSCFPNMTIGRLKNSKLIEALPPSSEVVDLCSTANFGSSNLPAVACMHAATDNVATAVIGGVVIVCVGIVSDIVALGHQAEPYTLTPLEYASAKSS